MSETKQVGSQKITTYYDDEKKEEEFLKHHSERRAMNRKIRDESGHAPVEPQPDHIDKPKKKAPVREEEEYYEDPEPRRPRKQKKQPLANQIGSRIPAALGGPAGRPAWLNTGAPVMPGWMRAGPGNLPSWAMGGANPLAPAASPRGRRRKASPPPQNNGLPPWFRY